jgi:hypothetical protein
MLPGNENLKNFRDVDRFRARRRPMDVCEKETTFSRWYDDRSVQTGDQSTANLKFNG